MSNKMHVKQGDTVCVITGKDAGKGKNSIGKVLEVFPKEQKVLVEGINMVTKHRRPRGGKNYQQGGLVKQEAPIHVSNVMLVCDKCGEPTRYGYDFTADGQKYRKCKKCGQEIKDPKKN